MTTTADITAAMRETYKQPEWALFFQVADGTGANQRRWADAVAMNMYPSRGLVINGYEFKVSRGDWKRELENPNKAEAVAKYCDCWHIVAPKGLVKDFELPATWGLLEFEDGKLRQKAKATQNEFVKKLDRQFVASMIRSTAKYDEKALDVKVQKLLTEHRKQDMEYLEAQVKKRTQHANEVLARHEALSAAMRHPDYGYKSEEEFINAIQVVMRMGVGGPYGILARMEQTRKDFHEVVEGFTKLGFTTERQVKKNARSR